MAWWLATSIARSQAPAYEPMYAPPSPLVMNDPNANPTVPARGGLSDWITYRRGGCEAPLGKICPLYTEVYFGGGAAVPIARGTSDLSRELETGWVLMGGARALFFNEALTRAWVLDAHVINIHQFAGAHNTTFPLTISEKSVAIKSGVNGEPNFRLEDMNRTMVGAGIGREWYLWNSADYDGHRWRVGVDGGGRYGTERLNVANDARSGHLTSTPSAFYFAAHTDIEFVWYQLLFHAGARAEYAYTFTHILGHTDNIQEMNFLFNFGVRF
jgi:hypothetical protein